MKDRNLEIRRLEAGEEQLAQDAVLRLVPEDERNGHTPSLVHLRRLLAASSNYLILALLDGTPIGFAIAYAMPRYDRDGQMAYLYEIGVSKEHRRKGVATHMVDTLKACMADKGITSVWVGTEVENTPAVSLYEATGAKLEPLLIHEFWYNNF